MSIKFTPSTSVSVNSTETPIQDQIRVGGQVALEITGNKAEDDTENKRKIDITPFATAAVGYESSKETTEINKEGNHVDSPIKQQGFTQEGQVGLRFTNAARKFSVDAGGYVKHLISSKNSQVMSADYFGPQKAKSETLGGVFTRLNFAINEFASVSLGLQKSLLGRQAFTSEQGLFSQPLKQTAVSLGASINLAELSAKRRNGEAAKKDEVAKKTESTPTDKNRGTGKIKQQLSQALFSLGQRAQQNGSADRAERRYEKSVDLNSKNTGALKSLAAMATQQRKYDQAIKFYTQVIEHDAKDTEAFIGRGIAHIQSKAYPKAIEDLTNAVTLDSKNALAHRELAVAYFHADDKNAAKTSILKAINLDDKNPIFHLNLGDIERALNNNNEALKSYKTVIEISNNNKIKAMAYTGIGDILLETKKYDEAISSYQSAKHADKQNPDIVYALAQAYHARAGGDVNSRDNEFALENYTSALTSQPKNPEYNYGIASFYADQNNPNQAIEHATTAIKNNKNHLEAHLLLAKLKSPQGAIEHYEAAVRIDPTNFRHERSLAESYSHAKNWEAAIDSFEKAIAKLPENEKGKNTENRLKFSIVETITAQAYDSLTKGDYETAVKLFDKAITSHHNLDSGEDAYLKNIYLLSSLDREINLQNYYFKNFNNTQVTSPIKTYNEFQRDLYSGVIPLHYYKTIALIMHGIQSKDVEAFTQARTELDLFKTLMENNVKSWPSYSKKEDSDFKDHYETDYNAVNAVLAGLEKGQSTEVYTTLKNQSDYYNLNSNTYNNWYLINQDNSLDQIKNLLETSLAKKSSQPMS